MGKPHESRAIRALVALVIVLLAPAGLALVWVVDFVAGGRWNE